MILILQVEHRCFCLVCSFEAKALSSGLSFLRRFRIPGGARNYVLARHVAVSLAEEDGDGGDEGRYFWMQLSAFDTRQVQHPRHIELDGITE